MAKNALGRIQDYLKQIVYGGNDGIVTTFAIVMGFAGAQADGVAQIGGIAVILFGLANLFADAVSMGLGDYLSSRSQDQMYARRRAQTRDRLNESPLKTRAALSLKFQARGLAPAQAELAADALMTHPEAAITTLLEDSPGTSGIEGDHPALGGLITFLSFVAFGILPLLPYLLAQASPTSLRYSILATFCALTLLGALRAVATGERLQRAVAETVLVGGVCSVVAFAVGLLVGSAG
ncbi:hypothetical protein ATO10_02670 [Actibacterium atlanticum]|uniref:GMP synthase n=1 Tax=Actibacterium atlanticum TaxID=1461693 RepID=A0A058ZPY5_9RHOB|nr:VIT1/CCC1 transporter family protein [Actibacterium atlanticum]KCV83628.1 hypothetical protein ATO10_02670 [Actibacterium atlanticum]